MLISLLVKCGKVAILKAKIIGNYVNGNIQTKPICQVS